MEEGVMFEGLNDMFPLDDSCSFSLWGGSGSGGGGMNKLGVMEVEGEANREEAKKKKKKKKEWSVELGKAVMVGDGNGDGERNIRKGHDEEQVREIHTQTEKDRRKKMRTMFSTLHGLVPHLSSKADKSTIVEGAVNYVRVLQQRLLILKSKKGEMLDAAELKNKEGISFNDPFSFPSPSFIKPQNQQQQEMLASREALLADYQYNNFSSSASVTPQNSRPTTPKTNLQLNSNSTPSPFGSPIMMINNNNKKQKKKNPRETAVKISLSPSSIAFKTFTSTNVVVSLCGREAQFSICGARKPGFYTGICSVLDKFQLEVKSFHISSDEQYSNLAMAMVQVTYLLNRYPVEEIYRAAGAELLQWVSSNS